MIRAIERFAGSSKQIIHHIWICDEYGQAVGVLSLTDLMRIAATYHLPDTVSSQKADKIGVASLAIVDVAVALD